MVCLHHIGVDFLDVGGVSGSRWILLAVHNAVLQGGVRLVPVDRGAVSAQGFPYCAEKQCAGCSLSAVKTVFL